MVYAKCILPRTYTHTHKINVEHNSIEFRSAAALGSCEIFEGEKTTVSTRLGDNNNTYDNDIPACSHHNYVSWVKMEGNFFQSPPPDPRDKTHGFQNIFMKIQVCCLLASMLIQFQEPLF